jgi:hypothetical protein
MRCGDDVDLTKASLVIDVARGGIDIRTFVADACGLQLVGAFGGGRGQVCAMRGSTGPMNRFHYHRRVRTYMQLKKPPIGVKASL